MIIYNIKDEVVRKLQYYQINNHNRILDNWSLPFMEPNKIKLIQSVLSLNRYKA
jgi:hypothetical protein